MDEPSPRTRHATPAPEPIDPRVVGAAARGEHAAWEQLVSFYGRRLFALAHARVRDMHVAEDITQSVFATLAARFAQGDYREEGRFEAWLFRIAINRVRDHARQALRRPRASLGDDPVAPQERRAGDGGEAAQLDSQRAALREALERLDAPDREVVELRHHAGLTFAQISELLEEPLGTLLARHHRALKKLRAMLDAPGVVARIHDAPTATPPRASARTRGPRT